MRYLNKLIYLLTVAILASCSGYEPEVSVGPRPDLTTAEVLAADEDYSILIDAITKAGISVPADVTLFAPNNAAFQKLFADLGVSSVAEIDNALLTTVLQYHLVSGQLLSSEISTGELTSAEGSVLNVVVYGDDADQITINGTSEVVDANRVSANATIHGINLVLLPPAGDLVDVLAASGNYNTLVAGITAAGLEGTLSGSSNFTIFAPTDDAFAAYGLNETNIGTITGLADILSFHVLSGKTFSQQLPEAGKLETILGPETEGQEEIIIEGTEIKTYVGGSQLSTLNIISTNMLASNGVVHGIDDLIFELGSIFDFLNPNTDTPKTGGDNSSPNALDNMGTIIEGLNYTRLLSLVDTSTVFVPFNAPAYSAFANDADAQEYLENHTFKGFVDFSALDNGSKVESLNGSEYYIAIDADGFAYVNGAQFNIIDAGFVYDQYNGNVFRYSGTFTPIPETGIVEVLNANGFTMMAAALEITGKDAALDAGDKTFFTVSDAVLSAFTGLADAAAVAALDDNDEDDAALIDALAEAIDNHTSTGADFAAYIITELPTLTNAAGNDIFFASNDGSSVVIILDLKDPDGSDVSVESVDYLYSNGVIHEVGAVLEFD